MRNFLIILILIFSTSFSLSTYAQKESERLVICRYSKAVRTLRIEKNKAQRCQAYYTKAGVDQNIGSSMNMESCVGFVNKIRDILEKAQWVCKDVQNSTVSTLIDPVM